MKKGMFVAMMIFCGILASYAQDVASAAKKQTQKVSVADMIQKAQGGDLAAQTFLAYMYVDGYEVPQDFKEAFAWFSRAAEQGCCESQHEIAEMYFHGKCVKENMNEAFKWYRRSAEQGQVNSQFFLGTEYHEGKRLPKNLVLSHFWFNIASRAFHSLGKTALGKRMMLEPEMTDEQLREANDLAKNWRKKSWEEVRNLPEK